jgi:hypothetical protein
MCPRPGCLNAEIFGRTEVGVLTLGWPDGGTIGGLTGDTFYCRIEFGGCGLTCPADWPPNVADIEALVMPRPVPATRNWLPGETMLDLLAENIEHGIVPTAALEGGPTRKLLEIIGDEVTVGQLGFERRPEIEGGRS